MIKPPKNLEQFKSLVEIVEHLRGPKGCPWDKEQTPKTLTPFIVEEAYELVDAIEAGESDEWKEELGDLLLQVVLQAQIADESGEFNIQDVIEGIGSKLVRRHPHVFSHTKVKDADEVLRNWEQIKKSEKKGKQNKIFKFPKKLPALQVAGKIGEKTKRYNFDWPNAKAVFNKVREEFNELENALNLSNRAHQLEELGDLLFSLAQLSRHLDMDPESALRQTNRKFEKRFSKLKKMVDQLGKDMAKMSSAELEALWKKVKKQR
jgi:tetrapyrrole methylase family protein / MazG family protein